VGGVVPQSGAETNRSIPTNDDSTTGHEVREGSAEFSSVAGSSLQRTFLAPSRQGFGD